MHSLKTLTLLLCGALLATASFAQTENEESDVSSDKDTSMCCHGRHSMSLSMGGGEAMPTRHWYTSNSFDGAIFSSAIFEKPGDNRRLLPTVRFSMLNIGYHFNYDFDQHFGMFTGLGIKNLGFIEKVADSTIKRRVYTIGVPLGFKLGNLAKRHYGFVGGGIDIPFNYREKGFVRRSDKDKFSEWFSDRTPGVMPYLFAGFSYGGGTTLKLQYYPGNFFNTEYNETDKDGITTYPYRGYSAHIICVTLGLDMHYGGKGKSKKEKTEVPEDADTANEM